MILVLILKFLKIGKFVKYVLVLLFHSYVTMCCKATQQEPIVINI